MIKNKRRFHETVKPAADRINSLTGTTGAAVQGPFPRVASLGVGLNIQTVWGAADLPTAVFLDQFQRLFECVGFAQAKQLGHIEV